MNNPEVKKPQADIPLTDEQLGKVTGGGGDPTNEEQDWPTQFKDDPAIFKHSLENFCPRDWEDRSHKNRETH